MVDWTDYIVQGAITRGLDPKQALHVVDTEGGRTGKTGDRGTSFGPFQVHVGGPAMPVKGLGDEMLARGLDPTDPRQSIDFSLDHAKAAGGFSPDTWHGLRGSPFYGTPEGYQPDTGVTHITAQPLDSTGLSPVGAALLGNMLKDRYGAAEEPTGNQLLDGLLKSSLFGTTEQAPQPSPTDVAAKQLQQAPPPPPPPQTVPEFQPGQPIPTPRITPIQQPPLPIPPAIQAPPPAPVPSTPMPGQPSTPSKPIQPPSEPTGTDFFPSYPFDAAHGVGPGATKPYDFYKDAPYPPVSPGSQFFEPPPQEVPQANTGNNLLDRLLKQVSPISTAQAASVPPLYQPQPQIQQPPAPPEQSLTAGSKFPLMPTGNRLLDGIMQTYRQDTGDGVRDVPPLDTYLQKPREPYGQHYFERPADQLPALIADPGAQETDVEIEQGLAHRMPYNWQSPLQRAAGAITQLGEATTPYLVGGAPKTALTAGIMLPTKADLQAASQGIQKIFSPTTVDAASRMGERLFRQFRGQAERETAQAEGQISGRGPLANPPAANMVEAAREPWRPLVAKYVPEFDRYLAQVRAAVRAGRPVPTARPALLRFLDFVEGRSSGVAYTGPPELRDLADTMQKIFADRAAKIQAEPSTQWAGFIQDYFPHMWKEKQLGQPGQPSSLGGARGQGSGRSLRQRTGPPTISDGIAIGLTPKSADPIAMMMDYVANIDRYLAHNKIFRIGRQRGMIKFYAPGHEPQGWMPLEGRLAERAVATGGVPGALGLKAYAPEGFARVYNNAISTGFFEGRMGGPVYSTILRVKNGITATVLALSGYHPMAMAQEATASGLANAIQGLKRGDIIEVAKQLGLAAMTGVKAIGETFGKGRKLERQYSGIHDYGPDWERIADLWAKGGGRGLGRGAEWQASAAHNFITSFRRGMTGIELRAGMRHVGEGGNILSQTGRAIGFTADQMGRIMDTLVAPLFDTMVPRIKKAAFFDEMSEWLRQNPTAGPDAQIARAREVLDRLDDRFGEMMMDNIFWGKRAKQSLSLLSTSLGWELGSVRSLGGAPFDFVRGQFASPRVRYTIGLAVAIAIENAMYQYLKTGKTPGQGTGGLLSPGGALDLTVPRTGGTTPEGAYERELLPGFEKDILGYWKDPLGEFAGKLSPFGKLGVEMLTGRDQFTGKPIDDYPKYTPQWFKAWGDHLVGAMSPIPFRQEIYQGSNIPTWERFMGGRPAPEYLQNPERMDQIELAVRIKDLKSQIRSTAIHNQRAQVDPKVTEQQIKDITDQIQMLSGYYQKRIQDDIAARARHFPATPMPTQQGMR